MSDMEGWTAALMGILLVLQVACDESKTGKSPRKAAGEAESQAPRPRRKQPAAASISATPIDITKVLGATATVVESVLGKEIVDADAIDENIKSYQHGEVRALVTYRDGRALDVILHGEKFKAHDLRAWLGINGREVQSGDRSFMVIDGDDVLGFSDMALPTKPIKLKKILGRMRTEVRKALGAPETELARSDVFKPWLPDDRVGVIVAYDEAGRVSAVTVAFDDGINADERRSEVLEWLGLPNADEVQGGGARYGIRLSAPDVTIMRLK